jgi:peptide/nickel transport system substrate-binding protein
MSFFKNLFFAFTKKERITFLVCSGVAVASLVVVAGMLIAQVTKAIPAPGGTYTEGLVGQPEYVNPVTAQSQADLALVKLIYSNIPDIADSITSSTDGMTWTVHLKNGLVWQDGQKLTSDDVIFTVQSIQNSDAQSPLAASWQGVTVSRASELELTFTLANPYAFFPDNLANLYIIPKHIFADVPPGNWHLSDYNLKPIGSGPYEFTSYNEGNDGFISAYHLAAWPDHPDYQANIKNINFSFFRNTNDLMKGFNSGTIDGFGGIAAGALANVARPYNVFTWRTPSYYAVFWNTSKNLALQDDAVRNALSTAVDRATLVASALGGHGVADYGPIPPDAAYFDPNVAPTSTGSSPLETAAAILNDAGWATSTSSNIRSKTIQKTNVPLAITLTVPDIDYLVATAETLQTTWQSIGVQVTIATDTPANIVSTTIKNRAYEGLLFGNVLGASSDLYSFWDSSERFFPGLNLAIYDNPQVDKLIESARENLNEASRTLQFADAENRIVADNAAVFLYSSDYLHVTDKNVQGITPDILVDPSDLSREMTGWYLNTTRVLK